MTEEGEAGAAAAVTPIERGKEGHAANSVHEHLRSLILDGTLAPGQVLNQVQLAPQLGVSRTPIREAIRMLQEEGLVDARPQKRARVVGFEPELLEAVYVQRILLETLAARVTAARVTDDHVKVLDGLLLKMQEALADGDRETWRPLHREFHLCLVRGVVSSQLDRAIEGQMDRSERYGVFYSAVRSGDEGSVEHEGIVEAYRARDGDLAADRLAAHLARTALTVIVQLAPTYDPVALRAVVPASA